MQETCFEKDCLRFVTNGGEKIVKVNLTFKGLFGGVRFSTFGRTEQKFV